MPDVETVAPERVGISAARLNRVDRLLRGCVEDGRLVGTVGVVSRRGQVVYLQAHGLRDREAHRPMTPDTVFRIYSMTKPVTAVAALMLFEDGHFLLDEPVAQYLPEFEGVQVCVGTRHDGLILERPRRPMTIQDLMRHTAGLSYGWYQDTPVDGLYREARISEPGITLAEAVSRLAGLPLVHHPGEGWRYSYATDVLGRLVEVVSGQSLADFFRDHIFKPLGMVDTGFHVPPTAQERLAALYSFTEDFNLWGGLVLPPEFDGRPRLLESPERSPFLRPPSLLSGGGGLVSTPLDYLRFAQMLLNQGVLDGHRLLAPKTVELMTLNHVPTSLFPLAIGGEPLAGYGYGLGVGVLVDTAASAAPGSVGTHGWGGAATTQYWVDPQEELIGLFMAQFMPSFYYSDLRRRFRVAVYQALMD